MMGGGDPGRNGPVELDLVGGRHRRDPEQLGGRRAGGQRIGDQLHHVARSERRHAAQGAIELDRGRAPPGRGDRVHLGAVAAAPLERRRRTDGPQPGIGQIPQAREVGTQPDPVARLVDDGGERVLAADMRTVDVDRHQLDVHLHLLGRPRLGQSQLAGQLVDGFDEDLVGGDGLLVGVATAVDLDPVEEVAGKHLTVVPGRHGRGRGPVGCGQRGGQGVVQVGARRWRLAGPPGRATSPTLATTSDRTAVSRPPSASSSRASSSIADRVRSHTSRYTR